MSDHDGLQIRSFRVVFDLERRLHRIDRWRLPLPYGLPLRSIAYAAIAIAAMLVLARLPLLGALVGTLPAPARLVLIPVAFAFGLTRVNVDGRSAHHTAQAAVLRRLRPRHVVCARSTLPPGAMVRFTAITIAPDSRGAVLRRGKVHGDAVALLRRPVQLVERGRTLEVRQTEGAWLDPGVEIRFDDSRRLVIA